MGTKPFWQSTTFRGLIVAAISSIYMFATGLEAGDEITSSVSNAVIQIIEWVGILLAFYGRWYATQPLGTTKQEPQP